MANLGAMSLGSPMVAWNAEDNATLAYTSNEAGYFTAFNVTTHEPIWSMRFNGGLRGSPLVEGSFVWVAPTNGHRIYKLDAGTGAEQCSAPLPYPTDASPTIATPPGGSPTIYIGVNDSGPDNGPMTAISEASCATRFSVAPEPVAGTGGIWDPASYGVDASGTGLVVFGTSDPDSAVYAVNAATGAPVWRYATQNPFPGIYDVGAGVTISQPGVNGFGDGVAYAVNKAGYLDALDLTTGALIWTVHDHGTISTPALVGSDLVYGDGDGVACLDAITGAVLWRTLTGANVVGAVTVVGPPGNQVVAYGDLNGPVHVVSLANGGDLFNYQAANLIVSDLAEYDGNLLVTTADGFLYDFAPGGGTGPAPSTAVASPADESSVANPNGSLTVSGTALSSPGGGIGAVSVAVQQGGSSGPWWDSAMGSWIAAPYGNPAAVASPGSSSTAWSLSLPVPEAGGTYEVLASAVGDNHIADISVDGSHPTSARSSFTVSPDPSAPTLNISSPWASPASQLRFRGTGFQAGELVAVALSGVDIATVTADSSGSLPSTKFEVPISVPFGPAQLTAMGVSSARATTAALYITNSWSQFRGTANRLGSEPNDDVIASHLSISASSFLTQAWSFNSAAPIRSSPSVVDAVAYFDNDAGSVFAVNIRNGREIWMYSDAGSIPSDSSPAVDAASGLVITANNSGQVVALNVASGTVRWTTALGTSAIESSPAISAGVVYVGSDAGMLYALNEQSGSLLWETNLGGAIHSSPAVDAAAGLVFVGDDDGEVIAASSQSGSILWSVPTSGPVVATPVVADGHVYIGSEDGTLYAMAESSGSLVWSALIDGPITASAALTGTTVAVGSQYGRLAYLDAATGQQKPSLYFAGSITGLTSTIGFTVDTTSEGVVTGSKGPGQDGSNVALQRGITSSPTVINGEVLVTGEDGNLHCYTIPGVLPY